MSIPVGFVNKGNCNVLKVKNAICGLKQCSFAWYEKVKDCLGRMGFNNRKFEACLFTKLDNNVKMIFCLNVDDFSYIFS